jgi:uncharacterized protein DUF4412
MCQLPLIILLATQAAVGASAGLKASMRLEIARVTPAPGADKSSPYAGLGPLMMQMLTPDGPVTMEWAGGAEGVRAALKSRLSILPAGSIVVQRTGAAVIQVLDPERRTYFEVPAASASESGAAVPDLQLRATGETATIAGQRAERYELALTLSLPSASGVSASASLPHDFQIAGDMWFTDAFAGSEYASMLKTIDALIAIPGLSAAVPAGRFPVKTRLRLTLLPDFELRSEVTELTTAPFDAALLTVPADYRKVDAPPGR